MNCKNCNENLSDNNNFCSNCGAKIIRNRLTLKYLFTNFSEQFLNYDNKFLQTFIHLFTKPEIVVGTYIDGTRKKYVNALRYFMIGITLSGIQLLVLQKFFPDFLDYSSMAREGQENFMGKFSNFTHSYQSFLTVLIVPFFTIMTTVLFLNKKKHNYTEHLIITIYLLTQISILNFLLYFIFAGLGKTVGNSSIYSGTISLLYFGYCFMKIYKLKFKQIILKILFAIPVGGFIYAIFSVILLIFYVLYQIYFEGIGLQDVFESLKPSKI